MTDFYQELSEFTGRDRELVELRCNGASTELAWEFPQYADNPLEFYRKTELYIFGLSHYQKLLQEHQFHDWLFQFIKNYNIKSMLDFGGGIGEYSIIGCKAGVETVYQDVKDSRTADYAVWRFMKHEITPTLWWENHELDRDFDLIVAMDVLEHLKDPKPVIEAMGKRCTYLISNPELIKYNFMFPEHISHPDLTPYFYNVHNYLWKNRNA